MGLGVAGARLATNLFDGSPNQESISTSNTQEEDSEKKAKLRARVDEGLPGDKFGKIRVGQYPMLYR
jgi:hypothetical protein